MLASGIAAPRVGALIDRHGGKLVLTIGPIIGGAGFLLLAYAHNPAVFYAGWIVIGIGMAGSLYDPAFAALARLSGARARTAITLLTLGGGLASTVFWPLGLWLLERMDWRSLCLVYAALNGLLVPLLHGFGVGNQKAPVSAESGGAAAETGSLPARLRKTGLALMVLIFMAHNLISNGMSVHLTTLMGAIGLTEAQAVWVGTIFGPAQSGGRLVELMLGGAYPVMRLGYVSIASMPVALSVLLLGPSAAILFAVLYGISNGLATIARGVMALGLFGREGYGRTLGVIAAPILATKAVSPLLFAWLIDVGGPSLALIVMFVCGLVATVAVFALGAFARKAGAG
jgi:MFS family permease